MTTDEKDYSDYIKVLSNFCGVLNVFAGFILTILTLLIALLPDPSIIMAQLTFFFLAVLFDLFLFLVSWDSINMAYFCKNVPPLTKRLAIHNLLSLLAYNLSGVAVILLFLLSDLIYLAIASGVVWALVVIIANFFFTWKPLQEYRETRAYLLGRVEKKEKIRD